MATEPKTIKFQLMLSESEAKAIDDWGFSNRIRTRAEAIRRLCQIGLIVDEHLPDVHTAAEVSEQRFEKLVMLVPQLKEDGAGGIPPSAWSLFIAALDLFSASSQAFRVSRSLLSEISSLKENGGADADDFDERIERVREEIEFIKMMGSS